MAGRELAGNDHARKVSAGAVADEKRDWRSNQASHFSTAFQPLTFGFPEYNLDPSGPYFADSPSGDEIQTRKTNIHETNHERRCQHEPLCETDPGWNAYGNAASGLCRGGRCDQ